MAIKIVLGHHEGFGHENTPDGIVLTAETSMKDREDMLIDMLAEWAQLNGVFLQAGHSADRVAIRTVIDMLRTSILMKRQAQAGTRIYFDKEHKKIPAPDEGPS